MKKYELTSETKMVYGIALRRIRACAGFTLSNGIKIEEGELGGWVEKEDNLSQFGNAWVYGDALSMCKIGGSK